MTSDPLTVLVGPVPIVLTPSVTFFVGISGSADAGFSTGVTQDASVTGGFSYSNGQLALVKPSPAVSFTQDPFGLDANLSAKAYAGLSMDLNIEGVISPEFSPDAYLQMDVNLLSNPWWILSAGLEGEGSVKVGIFGIGLADFGPSSLFDFSKEVAQANGSPATAPGLTALMPNSAAAGSSALTLRVSGSNFVPGSIVRFNGSSLPTTYGNPQQLTATIAANFLTASGTYPVTVKNPDQSSAISPTLNFVVQSSTIPNPTPTITGVSPSSATAGSGPLTVTIKGTGFLASSIVTFNGLTRAAALASASQLSIVLGSSDLALAGSFAIVVTNPAPGGGSSQPAVFTILQPSSNVTLQSLTLSSTSVIGGTPVTGTVSLSGPAPSGGLQVALSSSSTAAQVPSSVTVGGGQTTATFTITTSIGSVVQPVTIMAIAGGITKTATLTVSSIPLTNVFLGHSLELDGTTVIDGQTTPFHITLGFISGASADFNNLAAAGVSSITLSVGFQDLDGPVRINGNTVTFSGVDPSISAYSNLAEGIQFPAAISMGTLTVTINSSDVGSPFSGTLQFTAAGVTHQTTFNGAVSSCYQCTLPPGSPALQSLSLTPAAIDGGFYVTCTVGISSPSDGLTLVYLSSSNPSVPVDSFVLIPFGQTNLSFNILTKPVTTQQAVTVNAGLGTVIKTATIAVSPTTAINPWPYNITAEGNATIDGILTPFQCTVNASVPTAICSFPPNPTGVPDILLSILFDQTVSFPGHSVSFTSVDAISTYFNFKTDPSHVQPVTAGSLNLTATNPIVGGALTGTLQFTASGVSRQVPISATITNVQ